MLDKASLGQITSSAPPWYRQFWPWFLIALPATVVVAGFFTLYLAIKYSDDLVSDNYYRDGLAINQQLSQDIRATKLALSASLNFDASRDDAIKVVAVELHSERESFSLPHELTLYLLHPTDASADHRVKLIAAGDGRYRGQLPPLPSLRFYLRLIPTFIAEQMADRAAEQENLQSAPWRLAGEIDFSLIHIVELQASPLVSLEGSPESSNTSPDTVIAPAITEDDR